MGGYCVADQGGTFIGDLRGLSCRFWSHFGSSGTDGVVHKSEVSATKRESSVVEGSFDG